MTARTSPHPSIDVSKLPWVRPLVGVYCHDYARVAALFAGDPATPEAWRASIERVQRGYRERTRTAAILQRQLERRNAPVEAQRAAEALNHPDAVVVITGQQVGMLGGPLYTLLKAVTAVALARRVAAEFGVPVVPVFWADAEDHDWSEIQSAQLLDREGNVRQVSLPQPDGAGRRACGGLILPPEASELPALLREILPTTEFTSELLETVARLYAPGTRCGTAFAGWLDALVGPLGMPVFEADDPEAKAAVADVFVHELMTPRRTARFIRSSGSFMQVLGHEPQLQPDQDSANLFYLGEHGRTPIKWAERGYVVGEQTRTLEALVFEARQHPERFSPNVVTRPIVQDTLFPTVCYVAGPSELAYHAQLGQAYREFGVERPLVWCRATATLLDTASRRFLDRTGIPIDQLQVQDDAVLNQLVAALLPESIPTTLEAMRSNVMDHAARLREHIVAVDPTLTSMVDTTRNKILATIETMELKVVQAGKRKNETLRRQFARTRALLFPGGHPQERFLSVACFVNRYGFSLPSLLVRELSTDAAQHQLVVL